MSGVITDARAQISRIAEAGEAASEANAQRFKRFGALLEADYGKDKLQFFLSKPPEERRKDLDNLDKHVEDLKAHLQRVNLETERAKESALAIARSIERLFGEKKDLEEVALVESSEADTLQMTLKDIEPILEKLKILATDLEAGSMFMDLPAFETYAEVRRAVGIETPADVKAISTTTVGRKVIKSFNFRGLVYHKDHPGTMLDLCHEHYKGEKDYQDAIAEHLDINMSVDVVKKRALDLLPNQDTERQKTH